MSKTDKPEDTPLTNKGSARRAAVLKASAELFLEQGYERTSLAQIIERAGGSKSTLYAQFRDKAGLFNTVVIELCQAAFGPLSEGFPKNGTPKDLLTEIARRFLEMLWGEDVLALSRIVYTEGGRNPEIADVFFDRGYEEGYAQLSGYLRAVTPGLTKDRAMTLARMFLTMLPGDAYDRLLAGTTTQRTKAELDEQIEISVEWLVWQLGKVE
ncbi:TetR/AcrR family transcriptional regulator [Gymnodinialimonas hymeniacidonis]|uniref:TetR/AcrR family transcriptional regulator n=1 Tax=Gymnodinialimonas hymeniacidonis TaxID=3126508 RepID=UPI0034C61E91